MLQGANDTGERSRRLRREMSLPEILLWRALRTRPAGLKFRPQHPSGPFTADFYCHKARLIIEIDGEAHGRGDRPERDQRRDAWFATRGLSVLRVTARDVLTNPEGVVQGIVVQAALSGLAIRPSSPLSEEP